MIRIRYGLLLVGSVLLGLTQCSVIATCDRTSAAFVLPTTGDFVLLRGRGCIADDPEDPDDDPIVSVKVETVDKSSLVRVSIDSDDGLEVGHLQFADIFITPTHCDEGFELMVENANPGGEPVTGQILLTASSEAERCDVRLEAP
jgi:hypothetical protein